jgi:hypothetical protein
MNFTYLKSGVKRRFVNHVDLLFSDWHRLKMGRGSYATNIDLIEYSYDENNNVIFRAVVEVKQYKHVINYPNQIVTSSVEAAFHLARRLQIPFVFVVYNSDNICVGNKGNQDNKENENVFWVWTPSLDTNIRWYRDNPHSFETLFRPVTESELKKILKGEVST